MLLSMLLTGDMANSSLPYRFWFEEVLTGSDQNEAIFLSPFLRDTGIAAYDFPLFQTIMTLTGNQFSLLVPPRTAQMWLIA
jgi:hypothetical protein